MLRAARFQVDDAPPSGNRWTAIRTAKRRAGDYSMPSQGYVERLFGSWNKAIAAAGMVPRMRGVTVYNEGTIDRAVNGRNGHGRNRCMVTAGRGNSKRREPTR